MSRFAPALRKAAGGLDLPSGQRALILMEMASDLDAVYEHHRSRGMDEITAAEEAERAVLGSAEVLRRLSRMHSTSWFASSNALGGRLAERANLLLLAGGVLPVLLLALQVLVSGVGSEPRAILWPFLISASVVLALIVHGFIAHLRGWVMPAERLSLLLALAVASPTGAFFFFIFALLRSVLTLARGSDVPAQIVIATTIAHVGPALVLGLLVGLVGAITWFILLNRRSVQLTHEVEQILSGRHRPARSADPVVLPLVRRRST